MWSKIYCLRKQHKCRDQGQVSTLIKANIKGNVKANIVQPWALYSNCFIIQHIDNKLQFEIYKFLLSKQGQCTISYATTEQQMKIIHDKNTKEIATMKDVLISCLNLQRFWQFYSFIFSACNNQLKSYIKHSKECFILKKLGCALFFNPLHGIWISDETLFLLFDTLLECLAGFPTLGNKYNCNNQCWDV